MPRSMESLQRELAQHYRNLDRLEELKAWWGINVPLHILNAIDREKTAITRIKDLLADHEVSVPAPSPTAPSLSPPSDISETHLYLPPKAYHRLIGRSDELDRVMGALFGPGRKPMVAVVGLGGVGKTALAREAVEHCWKERYFDYIVWTSAKTERFVSEGPVPTGISDYSFDDLLDDIGRQCRREDITKMSLDHKKAAVKSLLAEKRVLIVMDNLETIPEGDILVDDVFQILGKSELLITSRHRVKHARVFTIDLGGLPKEDGVTFLREESKVRNIEIVAQAPCDKLVEIHQVTGGAPLAMKLVVGQISRQPMGVVLNELKEAKFAGQDYPFYRFVFKYSWDMLEQSAKEVLVSMSVFPPGIGGKAEDVRTVSKVEEPAFHLALDQLWLMSLVDPVGDLEQRRYTIHQLTQYFVLSDIVKVWG